ncbi:MAG: hypothetical protein ACOYOB_21230, partial [Myxococcota bacterium]
QNVFLDGGLRSVYQQLLDLLYPAWPNAAKPEYPFRHLENDGVWALVPIAGSSAALQAAKDAKAESWNILKHVECAQLPHAVFDRLAGSPLDRISVIELLAHRYFPADRVPLLREILGDGVQIAHAHAAETVERFTERALEEHLEQHWSDTPFAQDGIELATPKVHGYAGRQVLTQVNSIDLLGFQEQARRWWVFELKRDRAADAVVGQVSRYMGWMDRQRSAHDASTVGAIIVQKADLKLRCAVEPHERLTLWEFDSGLNITRVA